MIAVLDTGQQIVLSFSRSLRCISFLDTIIYCTVTVLFCYFLCLSDKQASRLIVNFSMIFYVYFHLYVVVDIYFFSVFKNSYNLSEYGIN